MASIVMLQQKVLELIELVGVDMIDAGGDELLPERRLFGCGPEADPATGRVGGRTISCSLRRSASGNSPSPRQPKREVHRSLINADI